MQVINIDNGGTFTDICVVAGGRVSYTKTLTTPFDLSQCLFEGLAKAARLKGNGESSIAKLLQATEYIRKRRLQAVLRTVPLAHDDR
jgi:N-methylhydantoinase A/oxoprolinase/acetone carboxylase beta subunit